MGVIGGGQGNQGLLGGLVSYPLIPGEEWLVGNKGRWFWLSVEVAIIDCCHGDGKIGVGERSRHINRLKQCCLGRSSQSRGQKVIMLLLLTKHKAGATQTDCHQQPK